MKLFKGLILVLAIGVCTVTNAQKSPEELGELFLTAVKENDSNKLNALIPDSETLLAFSKKMGMSKNQSEIDEFNEKYPGRVEKFLLQIEEMKEKGVEEYGINWSEVTFEKTVIENREINPPNQKKPVKVKDLTISFNYANESFTLKLRSAFDYKKIWYVGGEKPQLYDR